MKSQLTLMLTVILTGTTVAQAQDRGGWEFFNFREVQEEVRDTRQTPLPDFQSDGGRESGSQFDVLVAQCAAIEGQFGRACDAEKVKDILATSVIFESDAARVSDDIPPDGDVVSAANTVLKGASQEELKGYAWGLLYENAAHSKGQMRQMMKDAKMARMTDFTKALKDSMALMAGIEKAKLTGKSDGSSGESGDDADAASKKYRSGGHGMTNFGAIGKPSVEESCLKAIKWQLPKAGGGFGPMSAAGDTNPDIGGGTPTGPDGKPASPAEKLQNSKDIDCTMFDPTFGKKQVGQDQASNEQKKQGSAASAEPKKDAQGKTTTGSAVVSGTAEKKEGGSSTDQHTVSGKVEQKTSSDGKVTYTFKGTVTNENTGEEHEAQRNLPANSDGGPPKFFTAHSAGTADKKWEISIDKMSGTGGMTGMKPKGNAGYTDPNADVNLASSKQKCENATINAFKDCVFGVLAKEFEKDPEQQYCDEKGWVAGEGKTGGNTKNCLPKGSEEGLDQQMIFMKTGGGVTDPMMKQMQQGGTAQPPQDGSFKQAQPAQ